MRYSNILCAIGKTIKIVHKGKAGLKSRKAAEFRYLLPLNGEVGATDLQQRSASSMQAPVQA